MGDKGSGSRSGAPPTPKPGGHHPLTQASPCLREQDPQLQAPKVGDHLSARGPGQSYSQLDKDARAGPAEGGPVTLTPGPLPADPGPAPSPAPPTHHPHPQPTGAPAPCVRPPNPALALLPLGKSQLPAARKLAVGQQVKPRPCCSAATWPRWGPLLSARLGLPIRAAVMTTAPLPEEGGCPLRASRDPALALGGLTPLLDGSRPQQRRVPTAGRCWCVQHMLFAPRRRLSFYRRGSRGPKDRCLLPSPGWEVAPEPVGLWAPTSAPAAQGSSGLLPPSWGALPSLPTALDLLAEGSSRSLSVTQFNLWHGAC